jgi:hypothetical protein
MNLSHITLSELFGALLLGATAAILIPMWIVNLIVFIRSEYFYNPDKERIARMKELEEHFRRIYAEVSRLQNNAGEKSQKTHVW